MIEKGWRAHTGDGEEQGEQVGKAVAKEVGGNDKNANAEQDKDEDDGGNVGDVVGRATHDGNADSIALEGIAGGS